MIRWALLLCLAGAGCVDPLAVLQPEVLAVPEMSPSDLSRAGAAICQRELRPDEDHVAVGVGTAKSPWADLGDAMRARSSLARCSDSLPLDRCHHWIEHDLGSMSEIVARTKRVSDQGHGWTSDMAALYAARLAGQGLPARERSIARSEALLAVAETAVTKDVAFRAVVDVYGAAQLYAPPPAVSLRAFGLVHHQPAAAALAASRVVALPSAPKAPEGILQPCVDDACDCGTNVRCQRECATVQTIAAHVPAVPDWRDALRIAAFSCDGDWARGQFDARVSRWTWAGPMADCLNAAGHGVPHGTDVVVAKLEPRRPRRPRTRHRTWR